MTDKEKIIAEIRRLKKKFSMAESGEVIYADVWPQIEILNTLDLFIDALPAEQPSEDLEEAANAYTNEHPGTCLENDGGVIDDYDKPKCDFIAGAQWQKEQMMKSAIDGTVGEGNPGYPQMGEHLPVIAYSDMMLLPKHFKFGDKIKIIVIREDEQ